MQTRVYNAWSHTFSRILLFFDHTVILLVRVNIFDGYMHLTNFGHLQYCNILTSALNTSQANVTSWFKPTLRNLVHYDGNFMYMHHFERCLFMFDYQWRYVYTIIQIAMRECTYFYSLPGCYFSSNIPCRNWYIRRVRCHVTMVTRWLTPFHS